MKAVALFIYGINNLKGGGGAERFFADFYDDYNDLTTKNFNLYYIIDKQSVNELNSVGKLKNNINCLNFKIISNRFKTQIEFLNLLKIILTYKIKLIHLPLYNFHYLPLLKKLNKLPKWIKPKLVINISSCYLIPGIKSKNETDINTYFPLFKEIEIDGYFSWYRNFEEYVLENKEKFKNNPICYSITSRYSDTKNFYPQIKENIIVFAARLDEQKHPSWFIEAVDLIKKSNPKIIENWKFILCGNGILREELEKKIHNQDLESTIELKIEGELYKIFNKSKIFVSCQEFENFPSLSMAEAMASGNAIIARNVGQTNYFVKEDLNGKFIEPDTPEGLANALIYLINNENIIAKMGMKSNELMQTTHTFENFVPQIEKFWKKLI
ncbi:MAG: glycosyltransferase [Bacteroidetes bacterium]|nr:glycosyltransferase [Bacteroidota bacterium]